MLKFWGNVWAIVIALIIVLLCMVGFTTIDYAIWKDKINYKAKNDKSRLAKYQQELLQR